MPLMDDAQSRDLIIEHSQHPRRHRPCADATHEGRGDNPFCGDRIHLYLRIDDQGCINDASFEATGCAISMASASLMVERLPGLTVSAARDLFDRVHKLLVENDTSQELDELEALTMVRRYPLRVKCATLAWHTLNHVFQDNNSGPITTENHPS